MTGDEQYAQPAAAPVPPVAEDGPPAGTEKPESPEDILAGLAEALQATANVDTDLAGILAQHLLVMAADNNAVANAKAAITALAAQRATLPPSAVEDADG